MHWKDFFVIQRSEANQTEYIPLQSNDSLTSSIIKCSRYGYTAFPSIMSCWLYSVQLGVESSSSSDEMLRDLFFTWKVAFKYSGFGCSPLLVWNEGGKSVVLNEKRMVESTEWKERVKKRHESNDRGGEADGRDGGRINKGGRRELS